MRYEVSSLLGEGPLWVSYAVRDRQQGRDLCLRIPKPPVDKDASFAVSLKEVVAGADRYHHPYVESLLAVDEDEGRTILLSELTKGTTLAERIRKLAPFSVPIAVGMVISILEGLDALHSAKVAHGDLGPHSIAMQVDGSARIQLSELWRTYSSSPAIPAMVLPSMAPYLAPEISKGEKPSLEGDVYAVGVMLYQFIVGRLPFQSDTPNGLALKHASDALPCMKAQNPGVPLVLDEILAKAMSKERARRYQNAEEMLSDLRILQDALRFGKTLTWPIRPGGSTNSKEARQVAPSMSAIPREKRNPKDEVKYARDVPVWLVGLFLMVGVGVALFVVAFFYLNFSKPKQIEMPNLKNLTIAEAQAVLRQNKLQLRISRREPSEQIAEDHIIATDPTEGETVKQGAKVSARVSAGSNYVEIPDLSGHAVDEARSMLSTVGLRLDDDVKQRPSPKYAAGQIFEQTPKAHVKAARASIIHVSVSTGISGPATPDTPKGKPYIYTIRFDLKGLTQSVDVKIEAVDEAGNVDTILHETREPGERVEAVAKVVGDKVTLRVYYDGHLVKEETHTKDESVTTQEAPVKSSQGGEN